MSSWFFFWGFRILFVFGSLDIQAINHPLRNLKVWHGTSKCRNLEKEKEKSDPNQPVFLVPAVSFGVCVCMCGSQGRFFHPSTRDRHHFTAHFLRRRYRSSSHAWRRKLRTVFFFSETWRSTGEMFELSGWLWGILFVCSCFCKQTGRFNGYE